MSSTHNVSSYEINNTHDSINNNSRILKNKFYIPTAINTQTVRGAVVLPRERHYLSKQQTKVQILGKIVNLKFELLSLAFQTIFSA